jgi:hypothetical protein
MRLPSTTNLPNSFSPSPWHLRNHHFFQSKEQLESRANAVLAVKLGMTVEIVALS